MSGWLRRRPWRHSWTNASGLAQRPLWCEGDPRHCQGGGGRAAKAACVPLREKMAAKAKMVAELAQEAAHQTVAMLQDDSTAWQPSNRQPSLSSGRTAPRPALSPRPMGRMGRFGGAGRLSQNFGLGVPHLRARCPSPKFMQISPKFVKPTDFIIFIANLSGFYKD
jgi:hypothetical protein